MPKMVKLAANPAFKPSESQKAAYDAAKKAGPVDMDYVTAMENIQLSEGMYAILPEEPGTPATAPRRLEDMDLTELKVLMLQLGIKTEKQMKKSDVISLVRRKMDEISISEDE